MKRALIVPIAVAALLVPTAAASAKATKMTGSIQGDGGSKVTLKVKVGKDGEPRKMKSLKWSGVDLFTITADGGLGEPCKADVGGKAKKFEFSRGPAPSVYSWSSHTNVGGLDQQTLGAMPYMNPKQAAGEIAYEQSDGTYCRSREFRLSK